MSLSTATRVRIESMAQRLLAGEGAATVHLPRASRTLRCVAHGTAWGQLLLTADTRELELPPETRSSGEVLIDIVLHAPIPEASIIVASAHLSGTVHWLTRTETARARSTLAEPLTAPLTLDHGRVGVVAVDQVVLHDLLGTAPVHVGVALSQPPRRGSDPWVTAVDQPSLRSLCWDVMTGAIAGEWALTPRPADERLRDRALVLDHSSCGITLLQTAPDALLTAFVPADAYPHRCPHS